MCFKSSPSLLGQHGSCSTAQRPGELSENHLQNIWNKLPPLTPLILEFFHSVGNLKPKIKPIFKPILKLQLFLLNCPLQVSDWTHFNESDLALHVYESVELDIAFFNPNSEGDKKKRPFDYPIHLEVRKAWLENGRFSSGPNTPNETLYIVIMRVCEVCSDIPSVFLDKTVDHISDL